MSKKIDSPGEGAGANNKSPSSNKTVGARSPNDLFVRLAIDNNKHELHARDSVNIEIFGGTKKKPLYIGRLKVQKNGGKYIVNFNADRVYPVHQEVSQ